MCTIRWAAKSSARELRAGFESAAAGRGLVICLAGEPGIGKTTLVGDFCQELAAGGGRFTMAQRALLGAWPAPTPTCRSWKPWKVCCTPAPGNRRPPVEGAGAHVVRPDRALVGRRILESARWRKPELLPRNG